MAAPNEKSEDREPVYAVYPKKDRECLGEANRRYSAPQGAVLIKDIEALSGRGNGYQ